MAVQERSQPYCCHIPRLAIVARPRLIERWQTNCRATELQSHAAAPPEVVSRAKARPTPARPATPPIPARARCGRAADQRCAARWAKESAVQAAQQVPLSITTAARQPLLQPPSTAQPRRNPPAGDIFLAHVLDDDLDTGPGDAIRFCVCTAHNFVFIAPRHLPVASKRGVFYRGSLRLWQSAMQQLLEAEPGLRLWADSLRVRGHVRPSSSRTRS